MGWCNPLGDETSLTSPDTSVIWPAAGMALAPDERSVSFPHTTTYSNILLYGRCTHVLHTCKSHIQMLRVCCPVQVIIIIIIITIIITIIIMSPGQVLSFAVTAPFTHSGLGGPYYPCPNSTACNGVHRRTQVDSLSLSLSLSLSRLSTSVASHMEHRWSCLSSGWTVS